MLPPETDRSLLDAEEYPLRAATARNWRKGSPLLTTDTRQVHAGPTRSDLLARWGCIPRDGGRAAGTGLCLLTIGSPAQCSRSRFFPSAARTVR